MNKLGTNFITTDPTTNNLLVYVDGTTSVTFEPGSVDIGTTLAVDELYVNVDDLVVANDTVGIGTTQPDSSVELDVNGTIKTGMIEFEKHVSLSSLFRGAIGDLSYVVANTVPGFGIDNQIDLDNTVPELQHDIRLWFPYDRDLDAVVFNTNPETHTAALQLKKDNDDDSNVFTRFCTGDDFNVVTFELGGIISHSGNMGFYQDNTNIDVGNTALFDDEDAITAIENVPVITYSFTDRTNVDTVGFNYDDFVGTTGFYNDSAITTLNSKKLIVMSNLIPYMWSAIRNLQARMIEQETV